MPHVTHRVKCVETGEVFNSIKEASEKYKTHPASISRCCKGDSYTAGGRHWVFMGLGLTKPEKPRGSLCWYCHLADHWVDEPTPCPWAEHGKPVEGWTAKETRMPGEPESVRSFFVKECPLYIPNKREEDASQ